MKWKDKIELCVLQTSWWERNVWRERIRICLVAIFINPIRNFSAKHPYYFSAKEKRTQIWTLVRHFIHYIAIQSTANFIVKLRNDDLLVIVLSLIWHPIDQMLAFVHLAYFCWPKNTDRISVNETNLWCLSQKANNNRIRSEMKNQLLDSGCLFCWIWIVIHSITKSIHFYDPSLGVWSLISKCLSSILPFMAPNSYRSVMGKRIYTNWEKTNSCGDFFAWLINLKYK